MGKKSIRIVFLVWLLLVAMTTGAAAEGLFAFSSDNGSVLLDDAGQVHSDVYPIIQTIIDDRLFLFMSSTAEENLLLDAERNRITPTPYSWFYNCGNLLIGTTDSGQEGILSAAGEQLLSPTYSDIIQVGQAIFVGVRDLSDGKTVDLLDVRSGACEITADLFSLKNISIVPPYNVHLPEDVPDRIPAVDDESGKVGYLALDGSWAVEPVYSYEYAQEGFEGDYALVQRYDADTDEMQYNIIDKNGVLQFDDWSPVAIYRSADPVRPYYFVDADGVSAYDVKTLTLLARREMSAGNMIQALDSGRVCIGDAEGIDICDGQTLETLARISFQNNDYFSVSECGELLYSIWTENEQIVASTTGEVLYRTEADDVSLEVWGGKTLEDSRIVINDYGEDLFRASLADVRGNVLAGPFNNTLYCALTIDGANYFTFGTCRTREKYLMEDNTAYTVAIPSTERVGLMDADGNVLIPAHFDSLYSIHGALFIVTQGQYQGIVDLNGNWLYKVADYSTLQD